MKSVTGNLVEALSLTAVLLCYRFEISTSLRNGVLSIVPSVAPAGQLVFMF